jgi:hypothetical protein
VGAIEDMTVLTQSVARAFRNCKTNPANLPGGNYSVQVYLYFPETSYNVNASGIIDAVNTALRGGNKTPLGAQDILDAMKDAAFDRDLLKDVNAKATQVSETLKKAARMK